jgi:glycosyltransferase involved in cell wall biosynthesis
MPRFSTIIPLYNRGEAIRHSIESVLNQQVQSEVIVVDDGSSDDSAAQAEAFADRGVLVVRQQNAGPGAARNNGIAQATGDYLTFLDSDDAWFPHTLATFAQAIDDHNQPALVIGSAIQFSGDAFPPPPDDTTLRAHVFPNYYAASHFAISVVGCCFALRRDVANQLGATFNPARVNAEDLDLLMQVGAANGFVWLESPPLLAYKMAEGSAMADHTKTHAGLSLLLQKEQAHQYPGGPENATARRRMLTRYTRSASVGFKRSGESRLAWDLYAKTLAWNIRLGRWKYILGFPFIR